MTGYLRKCYIQSRHGEDKPLFIADGDTITPCLDNYAVIPREQYDRFVLIAEEWAAMKLRELTIS